MESTVAVVIPCYKVSVHICELIEQIGEEVDAIFVVDDCCPEKTGAMVERQVADPRVSVIYHSRNQGVGGAVLTGYQAAIQAGAEVIVKLDGDGQMDPRLIPSFVAPILLGDADYTKGNRFFEVETAQGMPLVRLIGNIGLSFLTKLSSGYWNLFDPTNGYTAISAVVAKHLPAGKISKRYFFESDMLFRLNTLRAVVLDIPMFAKYEDEKSNLRVSRELPRFLFKNLGNFGKRIVYNYVVRNFNYATIELFAGVLLCGFALIFGVFNWVELSRQSAVASAGTVMLAALPAIMGLQMILGFINYDMGSVPNIPLSGRLKNRVLMNLV